MRPTHWWSLAPALTSFLGGEFDSCHPTSAAFGFGFAEVTIQGEMHRVPFPTTTAYVSMCAVEDDLPPLNCD